MQRLAAGSALAALGLPLMLIALFGGAGARHDEYTFGWEQKAGVLLGCTVIWLACIVLSGWRPRTPLYERAAAAGREALRSASESAWLDLSQTRTVRRLGVLQSVVVVTAALCVLILTSAPWYVALLAGLVSSIALNVVISRFTSSALRRERDRRSR